MHVCQDASEGSLECVWVQDFLQKSSASELFLTGFDHLESQWATTMGYFQSVMGYFGGPGRQKCQGSRRDWSHPVEPRFEPGFEPGLNLGSNLGSNLR